MLALSVMCVFGQTPEDRTRRALDLILARNYQAFYELFSPEMKKAITLETYSQQADQIQALGPPTIGTATVRMVNGSPLVTIPLHLSSVSLNFLVSWNRDGKIQGTFFRPVTKEEVAWSHCGVCEGGSAFTEREVTGWWRRPLEIAGNADGTERKGAVPRSGAGARFGSGRSR